MNLCWVRSRIFIYCCVVVTRMVELRIDTGKDSPEQIRKVIRFLQSVVGDAPSEANGAADETPAVNEGVFNIFGDNSPPPTDSDESDSDIERTIESNDDDAYIEVVEY